MRRPYCIAAHLRLSTGYVQTPLAAPRYSQPFVRGRRSLLPQSNEARSDPESEKRSPLTARLRRGRHLGRPPKILVGKPGLDGHSNGAEQIAVRARDMGMEVVYEGIRLTPGEIVASARDEGVHLIGLSILSGSHSVLVRDVLERLTKEGLGDVPVIVGGIIPDDDAAALRAAGGARLDL